MSECNVENRTIYCNDNINILRGINNSCIDLIYLDPPFNSGREYTGARKSMAELAKFKDSWDEDDENIEWWFQIKEKHPRLYLYLKDVDDYSNKSTQVYLTMMAVRMLEMHRVLKETGSLYYHCDQSAGHYIKIMLDIIFPGGFVDEIIWRRASGKAKGSQFASRSLGVGSDSIFHYVKSKHYVHNNVATKLSDDELKTKFPHVDNKGRRYNTDVPMFRQPSMGDRPNLCYEYKGVRNPHPSGWRVSKEKLIEMDTRGDIIWREGKRPLRKSYADDYAGKPLDNLWIDIPGVSGKQAIGFPTQKPLALLERIITASSNKGDMVLDPFCGCATTCVAAERLERQWIGIDVWEDTRAIIDRRLESDLTLWEGGTLHKLSRPPIRTDKDPEHIPKRKREYIPDEVKEKIWQKYGGKCKNCGATENLQYDHIIPHSDGGSNTEENLQILCRDCNLKKSNQFHS